MIYLTYNDQPSGIYYSQVIDVCNFVNSKFNCRLRLVALVSFRGFWSNRKKIKDKLPKAIVLPMFPKHKNWRRNKAILRLLFMFIGKQNIWARGVFATSIALDLKKSRLTKKIVFDARGAYKAEFEEYLFKIVDLHDDIATLEREAIINSDFKLSVSNSLIMYWRNVYNYFSSDNVVIPCTQSDDVNKRVVMDSTFMTLRNELNFSVTDIVLVYSGSAADWQSFNLIDDFIMTSFLADVNVKLLLLSKINIKDLKVFKKFPERIVQRWVTPEEVLNYLTICDYGILIRENSITNQVASPTKFAEYLNAGLSVIISDNIGDFSKFVIDNNCGFIYNNLKPFVLKKINEEQKVINKKIASSYFSKKMYMNEYKKIIEILS